MLTGKKQGRDKLGDQDRHIHTTMGVGDGQGGLECCDSWGRKESDTADSELLNNNN